MPPEPLSLLCACSTCIHLCPTSPYILKSVSLPLTILSVFRSFACKLLSVPNGCFTMARFQNTIKKNKTFGRGSSALFGARHMWLARGFLWLSFMFMPYESQVKEHETSQLLRVPSLVRRGFCVRKMFLEHHLVEECPKP